MVARGYPRCCGSIDRRALAEVSIAVVLDVDLHAARIRPECKEDNRAPTDPLPRRSHSSYPPQLSGPGCEQHGLFNGVIVDNSHHPRIPLYCRNQLIDNRPEDASSEGIVKVCDGDIVRYLVGKDVAGNQLHILAAKTIDGTLDVSPRGLIELFTKLNADNSLEWVASSLVDHPTHPRAEINENVVLRNLLFRQDAPQVEPP